MFIRLVSDLHLEHSPYQVPALDTDKDTVLVMAGDVAPVKSPALYLDFIADVSSRFRYVIWTFGNHEYYGSFIDKGEKILNQHLHEANNFNNVFATQRGSVMIDDVQVVCATLWTDFDKANPLTMMHVQNSLNDYRVIRSYKKGYRKVQTTDILQLHREHVKYITTECKGSDMKRIVVTHHSPSSMSMHPDFVNHPLNGAFFSSLEDIVMETKPLFWFHGHTHHRFDYMIDNTRVVCNPRGYQPAEGPTGFDPTFIVEV